MNLILPNNSALLYHKQIAASRFQLHENVLRSIVSFSYFIIDGKIDKIGKGEITFF